MPNGNDRGNTADRKARKAWLLKTWESDRQGMVRCFRCGLPMLIEDVTVDRIVPGCRGGTYARNNIRPACLRCNMERAL